MQVNKKDCIGSFVSEKVLEKAVLNELNSLIKLYLNPEQLEKEIVLKQLNSEKQQLEKEISMEEILIGFMIKALNLLLEHQELEIDF